MAKVTIVLKDKKDGRIACTAEFEPALRNGKHTQAQHFAVACIEAMRDLADEATVRVR